MIVNDMENLRIDQYLTEKLNLSRSKVQKLIKDKNVLVNGKIVSASYKVKLDDEIINFSYVSFFYECRIIMSLISL